MLICDDVMYSWGSGRWGEVRRKSLSTFNLLRCCVLSVMSAENPVSQMYVEEKGTNTQYSSCNFTKKLFNGMPSS
ncbi:hypothetical protein T12_3130 [Trichinella patagoniensis]|uniref:Uncharacterized protein n=1 Tax=Trichinella patagoniensis TaxID=990121 RepID=A0A0V0ZUY3_9BILA|nr:hypothetical protein T12_3130 [Trichinella patagoniensis]